MVRKDLRFGEPAEAAGWRLAAVSATQARGVEGTGQRGQRRLQLSRAGATVRWLLAFNVGSLATNPG
jgi:hypothetical protein